MSLHFIDKCYVLVSLVSLKLTEYSNDKIFLRGPIYVPFPR